MPYEYVSHIGITWHTARSCNGGTCVRVAAAGQTVLIGDSKTPDGPILVYSAAEWRDFLTGAKNGDFDGLLKE
jgi:Domain of unknown function (DUF397)